MNKNKIISSMLAVTMALGMVGTFPINASASNVWSRDKPYISYNETFWEREEQKRAELQKIENEADETLTLEAEKESGSMVDSFPCYKQGKNSNTCWVECARAVINYKLGTNYDTDTIRAKGRSLAYNDSEAEVYINGAANAITIVDLLNYYISDYEATYYEHKITDESIKYCIDNDRPIVMLLQTASQTSGHVIVLVGYETDSNGTITQIHAMNPTDGEIMTYDYTSGSRFTMKGSNGVRWYWNSTIA
jgi:hypothetical protein